MCKQFLSSLSLYSAECTKCCTTLSFKSHQVSKSLLALTTSLGVYLGITGNRAEQCALTAKGLPSKDTLALHPGSSPGAMAREKGLHQTPDHVPEPRSVSIRQRVKEQNTRINITQVGQELLITCLVLTGAIQKQI